LYPSWPFSYGLARQPLLVGAEVLRSVLPVMVLFLFAHRVYAEAPSCSYTTYKWNVHTRQAVEYRAVRHPYSELQRIEIHEVTGCTVCEEDQVEITLPGINPFRVCKLLQQDVRRTLIGAIEKGERLFSVVGYRVGMTKGDIDSLGNRTQFSNHSFGVAIDINEEQNGLYDHCVSFGPACRLRRGGIWKPDQVGSLTPDSPIVEGLKGMGLKWGGQIEGDQKDFMHFSPSGY